MKKILSCFSAICLTVLSQMIWAAEENALQSSRFVKSDTFALLQNKEPNEKENPGPKVDTRGFGKPNNPSAHALIMTIGDYPAPIPKLRGVSRDADTATEIAQRMGVAEANIRVLKDSALTVNGIRQAFNDLESNLTGNDQVFIYYSGHGGRQLVQEPEGERCAEMLITADGQGLLDSEIEVLRLPPKNVLLS